MQTTTIVLQLNSFGTFFHHAFQLSSLAAIHKVFSHILQALHCLVLPLLLAYALVTDFLTLSTVTCGTLFPSQQISFNLAYTFNPENHF